MACALPLGWCAHERIEGAELVEVGAWRLATLGNGTLDSRNFALRPWPESKRPLEPGQVRLGLRCTGVNFRDVLIALGDPADYDVGLEGSGVVLEVADDVLGFAPGDRVMGHFLRRGTCCRRGSPDDRVHPLRVVLRTGSDGTCGFPHRVLRVGTPCPRQRGRAGASARRHRRCWHGCGAAG